MVDLEVEVDEEKVGAIPYTYFEVSQETKDALEAKANEFKANLHAIEHPVGTEGGP